MGNSAVSGLGGPADGGRGCRGNVGDVLQSKDERGVLEDLQDQLDLTQVMDRNVENLSGPPLACTPLRLPLVPSTAWLPGVSRPNPNPTSTSFCAETGSQQFRSVWGRRHQSCCGHRSLRADLACVAVHLKEANMQKSNLS